MDFDRHCRAIVTETTQLTGYLDGADLSRPVPTCPGWNVSQLIRHLDAGLRWAAQIVDARAAAPPSDDALRNLSDTADQDPVRLSESLSSAASLLAATLQRAGPAAQMWCPVRGGGSAFYARRFTHESAIHRADAAIGLGLDYMLDTDVAVDGVDEWLELGSLPFHFDVNPRMRQLLGPGRSVGLHAGDAGIDWVLDLTGDVITWRRSDEPTAAAMRGPVTDLLLTIYRRIPLDSGRIAMTGDRGLVEFWLERVGFG